MLPQIAHRLKKSVSLQCPREDKQNCNNNVNPQAQARQNKLHKLRESLQQDKIIVKTEKIESRSQTNSQQIETNLKKVYTWLAKKDYSYDILQTLLTKSQITESALQNHSITSSLRAKMVDWMIEVLSSYKMSEQAFFRSIKYMDLYFKKTANKLQVNQLHLIGVTCMFMASKYEEVYPFKLNTIYQKICRKKFARREIIDLEQQILSVLEFKLQVTTCYEILLHILQEMHIPLEPKAQQYLHKVALYLSKMAMHCPELAWQSDNTLAASILYISLKTVEQVESSLDPDSYIDQISALCSVKPSQLLELSQELLSCAKSFHKQYPSLVNLKKFNNTEYLS